jgi:hypothetical protein
MQCPQVAAHALPMQKNRIRGPIITLAAVATLGGGLWLANSAQEVEPAAAPAPIVATTVDTRPNPPSPPSPPAPAQFPATAAYSGVIETRTGIITVDITVDGDTAVAYVCDGASLEMWLRGTAADGALALSDPKAAARLEGRLRGDTAGGPAVGGHLWIGERKWDFIAPAVPNSLPAAAPVARR